MKWRKDGCLVAVMQGTLGHVTAFLPKERKLIFIDNFKTGRIENSLPAPKTAN